MHYFWIHNFDWFPLLWFARAATISTAWNIASFRALSCSTGRSQHKGTPGTHRLTDLHYKYVMQRKLWCFLQTGPLSQGWEDGAQGPSHILAPNSVYKSILWVRSAKNTDRDGSKNQHPVQVCKTNSGFGSVAWAQLSHLVSSSHWSNAILPAPGRYLRYHQISQVVLGNHVFTAKSVFTR